MEEGTVRGDDGLARRSWCVGSEDYLRYHDDEWGRPVVDDVRLYEKICLEGFQAGLAWITILRKRESFRAVFAGFDPVAVAEFDDTDVERMLTDASIVRHRGKIEAAINNAVATLRVQEQLGSLAALVWSFEPSRWGPVPAGMGDVPAKTEASAALSKALLARGFRFVGPTTAYAAMQSLGLVNDHLRGCHARKACEEDRRATAVPALPPS